ncbi:MAG: DUF2279 domain-containing protein [Bacteroidota bacterium]
MLVISQEDSLSPKKIAKRKLYIASGASGLTIGSLVALNQAWYADYNTGQFHFFNDNAEWLQMDKVGHTWTNYQLARLMMGTFKWAGYSKKQQLLYGGSIGFAYMTCIEVMDGFSKGWGFSWGDEMVNAFGTTLALVQHAYWDRQKIQIKFSYASSGLAKYNPALLGKKPSTQILKDYNGQTYWLTCNPFDFVKTQNKFPKWLNIALGYNASGMLGANQNKILIYDEHSNAITFNRERHFLFSLDVDLSRIKTKSRVLQKVFSLVNILKFPAPTIDFTSHGIKFHYFYY